MRIMDVDHIEPAGHRAVTDRLLADEEVHEAFRSTGTAIVFTDRRIITIQRNNLLTERIETTSFSYRSIRQFSVLEGTPEESRSELKIWIGAEPHPLHLRANAGTDLAPLQLLLAGKIH
jgi:hypothetical protein